MLGDSLEESESILNSVLKGGIKDIINKKDSEREDSRSPEYHTKIDTFKQAINDGITSTTALACGPTQGIETLIQEMNQALNDQTIAKQTYEISLFDKGELLPWYKKILDEAEVDNHHHHNHGPFSLFAIIDGHRGKEVAQYIRKTLMQIVVRNRDIMIRRCFKSGLKQVFIKLEEILASKDAQKEMKEQFGAHYDEEEGSIFKNKKYDPTTDHYKSRNVEWSQGAALTVMIVTSN